jgi:hypothetical integral membrane protein (TIGR02206 family)
VPPHPLYSASHVAWIAGIAGICIALSLICRRNLIPHQYIRAALVCLLVGGELQRYLISDIRFPDTLPLNLCNISTWVAALACFTLSAQAVEFAYFLGISGAAMALLNPESGPLPAPFYVNHAAIIITATALVYGRIAPLRRGAIRRAYAWLLVYSALMGVFDWRFGVNYGFLRQKPGALSLLTFLGPWPIYILWTAAVALVLFWLLWLPVRPRSAPKVLSISRAKRSSVFDAATGT